MLRAFGGGDDERHLRQGACDDVAAQLVERPRAHGAFAQDGIGLAKLPEPGQWIVGVVVIHVLVHLPAHPCCLQPLHVGSPGVAAGGIEQRVVVAVANHGAMPLLKGIDGAGPRIHAIRIGARLDRAVIGVAHGKGVRQRELERQVGRAVVAHGVIVLVGGPGVERAVVPGELRVRPGVGRARHAHLRERTLCIEVKRRDQRRCDARPVMPLEPDAALLAVRRRHGNGKAVAEAAHARQSAEVVVERTVFLHQDDDVPDIHDGAGGRSTGHGGARG